MAPILPFTSEEAWEAMPSYKRKEESIHLELFPSFKEKWLEDELFSEWTDLTAVRDKVLKELERKREEKLIGNSLEASVTLDVPASKESLLQKYKKDLASLLLVSTVHLAHTEDEEIKVNVTKAEGKKCQRCWNYSLYVGKSSRFPLFCKRCEEVVSQIEK